MGKAWKKIILYFYLAAIFVLQIIPINYSSGIFPIDKLYHFISAFLLAFILRLNGVTHKKLLLLSVLILIFLEFSQIPISYRSASLYDLTADFLGVFIFMFILFLAKKLKAANK